MIIIFLSKSFTAISFIATSSRFHIIGPNTNMLCLKGDYSSQLDSLADEILEQRKRLKNEGKPHAQSDVFFAVKEFFRSHLLSALFPDKVDKLTPMLGYLPGHMPYELGEELRKLGLTIVNKKADDTCHIDRN